MALVVKIPSKSVVEQAVWFSICRFGKAFDAQGRELKKMPLLFPVKPSSDWEAMRQKSDSQRGIYSISFEIIPEKK